MSRAVQIAIAHPEEKARRFFPADPVAIFLMAFGSLNLNGVIFLLTGIDSALSGAALAAAAYLLYFNFRGDNVDAVYTLFLLCLLSYLAFGSWANLVDNRFEWFPFAAYAATIVMVSGLFFYFSRIDDEELRACFRYLRIFFVTACLFTLASDHLEQFFNYVAPSERASGLFANPNEAAIVALYAIVFTVADPDSKRSVTLLQLGVAVAALVMTFSKNGMLTLAVLGALYLFHRRSLGLALFAVSAFAALYAAAWYIIDLDLFGVSDERRERVVDMMSLLTGDFNDKTTTGRTVLWQLGLSRIAEIFPWGAGLGRFHFLEGGARNAQDQWLGVHNTYLMLLGEGGLPTLLLFLGFLARMIAGVGTAQHRVVFIGCLLVFLIDMIAVHGALAFRAHDVVLGLLIALSARGAREAREPLP